MRISGMSSWYESAAVRSSSVTAPSARSCCPMVRPLARWTAAAASACSGVTMPARTRRAPRRARAGEAMAGSLVTEHVSGRATRAGGRLRRSDETRHPAAPAGLEDQTVDERSALPPRHAPADTRRSMPRPVVTIAGLAVVVLLLFSGGYGFHRD